jgi:murein DD-endopeptidase MepM/ murein hydrolase activator NlpD
LEAAEPVRLNRRAALAGLAAAALARPAFAQTASSRDAVLVRGRLVQGGAVIGRAAPGAELKLDGQGVGSAGAKGWFVIGFDRDAAAQALFETRLASGPFERELAVAPGTFVEQHIDGLPQDQVAPTDPALLERIKREVALKAEAFASRAELEGFSDGFAWPLKDFRISSPWGVRRILDGVPKTPHYGIDLAAPKGTPIYAPAPGLVVLAEPDLHFEGGLTLIDHGQGLISMYLHQSGQHVAKGQMVERGQRIGEVGMTGRATGPHLCWRMKWRGRNCDPSLLVNAPAVAA